MDKGFMLLGKPPCFILLDGLTKATPVSDGLQLEYATAEVATIPLSKLSRSGYTAEELRDELNEKMHG